MNETTHTPGPWIVDEPHWTEIQSANGKHVASAHHVPFCEDTVTETKANARLIAAAPDLLAACESWVAYFDQLDDLSEPGHPLVENYHRKRVEATRAVVSKAKGGAA